MSVSLNRETKENGRTERISIETDHQLELEFPAILYGSDKLQLIVYPVKSVFSTSSPIIIIKDASTGKVASNSPVPSSSQPSPGLTEDEQKHLNEELSKRGESMLWKCDAHAEIRVRGKLVKWPWRIKCGICSNNVQLRYDADLKGRVSSFERHHFSKCRKRRESASGPSYSHQRSIKDLFLGIKRTASSNDPNATTRQEKVQKRSEVEIDSDIDVSDLEM